MLLSVIVPMYNSSYYLDTLFESLNLTATKDVELIIVDDGSKDDTYEKCIEYKRTTEHVIVIHNENHGVSYSRNCGMQKASGKYIMFVDSDDKLVDNWYDAFINSLDEAKDSDIIVFSKHAKETCPNVKKIINSIVGIDAELGIEYLTAPVSKAYKRSFIQEEHIEFNTEVINGEDALFNIEAFLKSDSYYFDRDSIYSYLINFESSTHRYDHRFLKSNECYYKKLHELLSRSLIFQSDEIERILNFTFWNSMYIYAGRVSKIKRFEKKKEAINCFYKDSFHAEKLKTDNVSKELPMVKRIVCRIVKSGFLFAFEIAIAILPRKKNTVENYWVEL